MYLDLNFLRGKATYKRRDEAERVSSRSTKNSVQLRSAEDDGGGCTIEGIYVNVRMVYASGRGMMDNRLERAHDSSTPWRQATWEC
jgi:hypothetical protein